MNCVWPRKTASTRSVKLSSMRRTSKSRRTRRLLNNNNSSRREVCDGNIAKVGFVYPGDYLFRSGRGERADRTREPAGARPVSDGHRPNCDDIGGSNVHLGASELERNTRLWCAWSISR